MGGEPKAVAKLIVDSTAYRVSSSTWKVGSSTLLDLWEAKIFLTGNLNGSRCMDIEMCHIVTGTWVLATNSGLGRTD
jgi:hypothetical protein